MEQYFPYEIILPYWSSHVKFYKPMQLLTVGLKPKAIGLKNKRKKNPQINWPATSTGKTYLSVEHHHVKPTCSQQTSFDFSKIDPRGIPKSKQSNTAPADYNLIKDASPRARRGGHTSVVVVGSSSTAWPTCSSSREYRRCCCKSPTHRINDQQSTCKRAQVEAMMALVDDVVYLAGSQLGTVKAHRNIKLPTTLTFPNEGSKDYLTTIICVLKFNILQSTRVSSSLPI